MSGRKNSIEPTAIFNSTTGTTMTGTTTLTSVPTVVRGLDAVWYDVSWTGTPNGTFNVQVAQNYNIALPNQAVWRDLTLDGVPTVSGSAGSHQIRIGEPLPFYAVRIQYINTSGTGVLAGMITGKTEGA